MCLGIDVRYLHWYIYIRAMTWGAYPWMVCQYWHDLDPYQVLQKHTVFFRDFCFPYFRIPLPRKKNNNSASTVIQQGVWVAIAVVTTLSNLPATATQISQSNTRKASVSSPASLEARKGESRTALYNLEAANLHKLSIWN